MPVKQNNAITYKSIGKDNVIWYNSILQDFKNQNMCNWCGKNKDNCVTESVIRRRIFEDHKIVTYVVECPYFIKEKVNETSTKS